MNTLQNAIEAVEDDNNNNNGKWENWTVKSIKDTYELELTNLDCKFLELFIVLNRCPHPSDTNNSIPNDWDCAFNADGSFFIKLDNLKKVALYLIMDENSSI